MAAMREARSRPCRPRKQGEADEPVAADCRAGRFSCQRGATCFLGREGHGFGLPGVEGEDAACAEDDDYHEEGAREVADEGEEPVGEHAGDGEAAVEDGDGGVLWAGGGIGVRVLFS